MDPRVVSFLSVFFLITMFNHKSVMGDGSLGRDLTIIKVGIYVANNCYFS